MRVNPFVYGILALVIFVGVIFTAQAAGFWSISGKVSASGEKISATGKNVEEIKGWMTLGEVAKAYNVPIEEIIKAFGLPDTTNAATQIKSLEGSTFTTSGLRTWLAERMPK